ncbi:MAG: DUF2721 domain-containing protein [Hyphomicrobiales bacterium]|jgi:hypothetical protein
MPDMLLGSQPLDTVAHIIQVALAPAFLLSALATLLNVFSTRLGRVSDQVDAAARELEKADAAEAAILSRRLSHLRARSLYLDLAVVLASAGGCLTGISVLTLFVGALRDRATATILFACFGLALLCLIGAVAAFLVETLLAGQGVRVRVARQQDEAAAIEQR